MAATAGMLLPAAVSCQNPIDKKLGIALVGLGNYSTRQLSPSLQNTRQCELKGIVTGTPSKAEKWQKDYDLDPSSVYNYDTFDQIAKTMRSTSSMWFFPTFCMQNTLSVLRRQVSM